nr:phosphoinositide phosphatase SAC1 isoform X1 [Ipomoea trifida]
MVPFGNDSEKEKYYANLLRKGSIGAIDDTAIVSEMEAELSGYDKIGNDLGIFPESCKALAGDPSQLTRWLVGEDRLPRA